MSNSLSTSRRLKDSFLPQLFIPLVGLLVFAAPVMAAKFSVMTEELPPFNYTENGRITGFSTEIVLELCARVGHPKTIKSLPWARAYKALTTKDNMVLYSTTRTAQREDLFKWVGPLYKPTIVFFAKKGTSLSITSMADAKTVKKIGTYIDDAEEALLRKAGFKNLASVGNDLQNPKKLLRGRIDLWIAGDLEGFHKAKAAGLKSSDIEIVYRIKTKDYFIAFSKSTPDAEIQRWQSALDAMKQDGAYESILEKYL